MLDIPDNSIRIPEEGSTRTTALVVIRAERDWQSLYEQESRLTESLRSERLHWYSKARQYEGLFRQTKGTLWSTRQELDAVRRAAKESLGLEAEVRRLRGLLEQAGMKASSRTSMGGLRLENGELRARLSASQECVKRLEQDNARLRSSGATLSKALFGQKSERGSRSRESSRPSTGRVRGQQVGSVGHGRTDRSQVAQRVEEYDPVEGDRTCTVCGKAYSRSGDAESALMEIEVQTYRRIIRRSRWQRRCDCSAGPRERMVRPVARLFRGTAYGVSLWSRFLYEVYGCHRPVNRFSAWLSDQGIAVSAGTLSDSIARLSPLFAPIGDALHERLNAASLCQGDETGWRVQSLPGLGKAWLWVGLSSECVVFRVDASRSAQAAMRLFGSLTPGTILVCDRYSAYRKLVRLLGGGIRLSVCWAHARRDVVRCADAHPDLRAWSQGWLERIAELYHLNRHRIECHAPARCVQQQSTAFRGFQVLLEQRVEAFFARAGEEIGHLVEDDARHKSLASLVRHQEGLCVFVGHPDTPMDNNRAERALRAPVIGRKLSLGSNSLHGAAFTAQMYSIIATLRLNQMDVPGWLHAWLQGCADNGGRAPEDLGPWLPWTMDAKRREQWTARPP